MRFSDFGGLPYFAYCWGRFWRRFRKKGVGRRSKKGSNFGFSRGGVPKRPMKISEFYENISGLKILKNEKKFSRNEKVKFTFFKFRDELSFAQ